MLLAQVAHEFGDIDAALVLHAGEGYRRETVLGEKIETRVADPIMNERVSSRVTLEPFR